MRIIHDPTDVEPASNSHQRGDATTQDGLLRLEPPTARLHMSTQNIPPVIIKTRSRLGVGNSRPQSFWPGAQTHLRSPGLFVSKKNKKNSDESKPRVDKAHLSKCRLMYIMQVSVWGLSPPNGVVYGTAFGNQANRQTALADTAHARRETGAVWVVATDETAEKSVFRAGAGGSRISGAA